MTAKHVSTAYELHKKVYMTEDLENVQWEGENKYESG